MSPRIPLAVLLLALGAAAQAAPARTISPQAKALLTQMSAAEKALTSYSGTVSVLDSTGPAPSSQSPLTIQVRVKKPNLAAVSVSSGATQKTQAVADGATLSLVDFGQKKYVHVPMAGKAALEQVLGGSQSTLLMIVQHPEAVTEITTGTSTQSLTIGPAGVLGGKSVKTVVAKLEAQSGASEVITFSIGAKDHLLRGVALTMSAGPGHTASHTEGFTDFHTGPALTAADFAFTPPPGLTKVASLDDMQPPMYDPRLKVGADPFPFTAPGVDGGSVSLADYKGKVVLLDFWATWCGPCRGEMPNVVAAYNKYHAQGFDVLGVSLDQAGAKATLTDFTTQNKMPWRQAYDGGGWQSKVAQQYGVQAIPFSLLIGRDGKIAAVDARGPALAPAIQAALAQK